MTMVQSSSSSSTNFHPKQLFELPEVLKGLCTEKSDWNDNFTRKVLKAYQQCINTLIPREPKNTKDKPSINQTRVIVRQSSSTTVQPKQLFEVPEVLKSLCMEKYDWDGDFTEKALQGYQQFMECKRHVQDWHGDILIPSATILCVWFRHFKKQKKHYAQACHDYYGGGRFIDFKNYSHYHTGADRTPRIIVTKLALQSLFGDEKVDKDVWPFVYDPTDKDSKDESYPANDSDDSDDDDDEIREPKEAADEPSKNNMTHFCQGLDVLLNGAKFEPIGLQYFTDCMNVEFSKKIAEGKSLADPCLARCI